jgi:hypothetical protein
MKASLLVQKPFNEFVMRLLLLFLAPAVLVSCSSGPHRPASARPSAFLSPAVPLDLARKTSPFSLAGGVARTEGRSLYVAPVSLDHLRLPSKALSKLGDESDYREQARKVAEYGRREFVEAFQKKPEAVYRVSESPDSDGATLELAITELNRGTVVGAVGRAATRFTGVPGLSIAMNATGVTRPLKANIAIEGKLIENRSGRVVYQFADIAESKQSLLPITDLAAYGQARQAMRDWAVSFEKVTRSAPGKRVRGPLRISLY